MKAARKGVSYADGGEHAKQSSKDRYDRDAHVMGRFSKII